jgi:hypothetical protein
MDQSKGSAAFYEVCGEILKTPQPRLRLWQIRKMRNIHHHYSLFAVRLPFRIAPEPLNVLFIEFINHFHGCPEEPVLSVFWKGLGNCFAKKLYLFLPALKVHSLSTGV